VPIPLQKSHIVTTLVPKGLTYILIRTTLFLDSELLIKDNKLLELRDLVKNPKYAESLRRIQSNPDDLHTGNLSKILLDDVNKNGGNMTADDLKDYTVKIKDPIRIKLSDKLTLHTSPLPGGGSVLVHILNMVKGR